MPSQSQTPPEINSVLIVEDNQSTQRVISQKVLEAFPLPRITVVGTLQELERQAALHEQYDVILVDLMLPDSPDANSSTFDFCRKHWEEVPTFVISAANDPELARALIRKGAVDYIAKRPHWQDDLGTIMRRGLNLAAALSGIMITKA